MSARSSCDWLEGKNATLERSQIDKARFRVRFQRSLSACVRKHFSVAECFGLIWEETLEVCALSDTEQLEMYHELLGWAKNLPEIHLSASYSRLLFTTHSQPPVSSQGRKEPSDTPEMAIPPLVPT